MRMVMMRACAVILATSLCGCSGVKPPGPGTEPEPEPGTCAGDQQFQLTGAGSSDDPCAFDPVVVRNSNCKLLRMDVAATGSTRIPPAVIFEKGGATHERTPIASPPWSATTTALACNDPPCADDTYAVRLTQPENPGLCSEYGTVTLTLVMR